MKTWLSPKVPAYLKVGACATVLVASFAVMSSSIAVGRGGGGGHAREHNASPRGGGPHNAQRQHTRANDRQADVRTRNVRNTSVNNVNVNRNVNVNVDNHGGHGYHGGWDDDYHPVATAVAVTAAVGVTAAVVGSIVHSVPANCVPVNYRGMVYQQCGSTWYQPQGAQFVVVNAPY
ncbi:hypothetical protein [Pandoraea sp. PE-S2R-1]|uniref:hypothetical protein n=1 Tax=Pandoraea sp. PE-S2R-1 TaxID=1986994 RepID=UPI000B3F7889|nr:hypothetical protein [Pandoraea sp. PE-S2R-1]